MKVFGYNFGKSDDEYMAYESFITKDTTNNESFATKWTRKFSKTSRSFKAFLLVLVLSIVLYGAYMSTKQEEEERPSIMDPVIKHYLNRLNE